MFTRRKCVLLFFLNIMQMSSAVSKDVNDNSEPTEHSHVEVRAVFIEYQKNEWPDTGDDSDLTRFQREELYRHGALQNCRRKLALTVKLTSESDKNTGEEYIPIEHVMDGPSKKRVRLLDPYVLRLRREAPLQAYKLRPVQSVLGVLSKRDSLPSENEKPTKNNGGMNRRQRKVDSAFDEDMAEWSSDLGSLSSELRLEHDAPRHRSFSVKVEKVGPDPAEDARKVDCGLRLLTDVSTDSIEALEFRRTNQKHHQHQTGDHYRAKRDVCDTSNISLWRRDKRNEHNLVVQREDNTDPNWYSRDNVVVGNVNDFDNVQVTKHNKDEKSVKYDPSENSHKLNDGVRPFGTVGHRDYYKSDTVHNLRDDYKRFAKPNKHRDSKNNVAKKAKSRTKYFKDSDQEENLSVEDTESEAKEQEYELFEIGDPDLWYTVNVQLFEKISTAEGKTVWNDITKGEVASVGTMNPVWSSQDAIVRYRSVDWVGRDEFTLPKSSLSLLVPSYSLDSADGRTSPIDEKRNYIIVPVEDVLRDKVSNKRQENNSYFDATADPLFENEESRRERVVVRVGRAWLSTSEDQLGVATRGSERFLTIPHQRPHRAQIDLEVRADDNLLVRVGSSGRISTVVSDSTRRTRTLLTVQVTNTGLTAARFRAVARDCGQVLADLTKDGGSEAASAGPVLLPPQHTERLKLELPMEIPTDSAHCSVALVNDNDEVVAMRDVAIKKGDRCFCVWYCDCVCMSEDPKLLCVEMGEARAAAAGLSSRERPRRARSVLCANDPTLNVFVVVVGVLVMLLLLGFAKACLGMVFSFIGVWGLDRLVQMPRKVERYHEPWLRGRPVKLDKEGWPVHPDTKQRVRCISMPMEFFLNVIYFVTVPCLILREVAAQIPSFRQAGKQRASERAQQRSKKYSVHDIQTVSVKKKRGALRRWMTPGAEVLSTDLWDRALEPFGKAQGAMQPLLLDGTRKPEDGHSSCLDSDQDDTNYVLTQMQKSKESLARSHKKPDDDTTSPRLIRKQWQKAQPNTDK